MAVLIEASSFTTTLNAFMTKQVESIKQLKKIIYQLLNYYIYKLKVESKAHSKKTRRIMKSQMSRNNLK